MTTRLDVAIVSLKIIRTPVKIIALMLLGSFLLFTDCTRQRKRFQPTTYFPIKEGNTWIFNGQIHKMKIANITEAVGDKIVTIAYFDSLDALIWNEKYTLVKNQLFLNAFEPTNSLLPIVTFDEPLPFAPLSGKVGYKTSIESIETQIDSLMSTTKVEVEYVIEAVEDVIVPDGVFMDCIKMKINIIYPQTAFRPFFIGEQYWWFAPHHGPVKYDLPSAYGELVKMEKGVR